MILTTRSVGDNFGDVMSEDLASRGSQRWVHQDLLVVRRHALERLVGDVTYTKVAGAVCMADGPRVLVQRQVNGAPQ